MTDLLNVDDAVARILENIERLPGETIDLGSALGRVLADDIQSENNIPPFSNSSMDGYAVRANDTANADPQTPARLRVTMDIPAGKAAEQSVNRGEAARIMTGAPMPDGADAVIPVEDTDSTWGGGDNTLPPEVLIYKTIKPGGNVRGVGEDIRSGQVIVRAGTTLRPQELGVLASIGKGRIPVTRQPKVAILSTGDELLSLDAPLTPGKIYDSNSYTTAGLVAQYGAVPVRIPTAKDTVDDVRRRFQEALSHKPDVILSSAGVSVGAFDVVRLVLDELGEVGFWRVNLRPGKPLAYGHIQGIPFFGLPGNPVSAMVTFEVFVRPTLFKMLGKEDDARMTSAIVQEDIHSDGRRSYLRVRLLQENGQLVATMTGTQSSGVLMSMVLADGLLIVPEGRAHIPAGETLPVRLL